MGSRASHQLPPTLGSGIPLAAHCCSACRLFGRCADAPLRYLGSPPAHLPHSVPQEQVFLFPFVRNVGLRPAAGIALIPSRWVKPRGPILGLPALPEPCRGSPGPLHLGAEETQHPMQRSRCSCGDRTALPLGSASSRAWVLALGSDPTPPTAQRTGGCVHAACPGPRHLWTLQRGWEGSGD